MKKETVVLCGGAVLSSAFLFSPVVFASDSPDATKTVAGSEVSELSAWAASRVAGAPADQKTEVVVAVVRQAVAVDPAADVPVVFAVGRESAASAPAVAVTASRLQPDRMALIANAAAVAAPSQAGRMTAALIQEFPHAYGIIAVAAAQGAPLAGREVLAAVGDSIPALRAPIQALSDSFASDAILPVATILAASYDEALGSGDQPNLAAPLSDSPVLGPPFLGSTTTPITYSPAQTIIVSPPRGGGPVSP